VTRLFQTKKTDLNMNKRMKDPKGDLRFVHKLTRIYDFSSLKLTAMAYRRLAFRISEKKEFTLAKSPSR
jgi:hypothetical protein